ncbi:HNH endonuclease [Corynebacterium uberis]|nr:HNH endonuclease [Corynebacterium uberis]UDL76102.1 HNH endonuclease [Corynebacterium uberis]UDL78314.1 HNH endonuclease [Corynebacterium uberis]UDL80597.1 HNH endonuclease [Corynebacterium uberis]UDL82732.1 HNH endonuclease [Corynebacterium uberis]
MVWHHVENGKYLISIPAELHKVIRHAGGRATRFSRIGKGK